MQGGTTTEFIIISFSLFSKGDQQNAAFCFVSLANIFCCFLSMGLVFVPKILFIRKHSHDPREKEESQYMSKEQEEECKQLNMDNETLRKKLKEVGFIKQKKIRTDSILLVKPSLEFHQRMNS